MCAHRLQWTLFRLNAIQLVGWILTEFWHDIRILLWKAICRIVWQRTLQLAKQYNRSHYFSLRHFFHTHFDNNAFRLLFQLRHLLRWVQRKKWPPNLNVYTNGKLPLDQGKLRRKLEWLYAINDIDHYRFENRTKKQMTGFISVSLQAMQWSSIVNDRFSFSYSASEK